MFKRNFTFGLASPKDHNDGAAWVSGGGSAKAWTQLDGNFPPGTDGSDISSIACAVNTFGQDDIFGYQYNGLCFNGNSLKSGRGTYFPPPPPLPPLPPLLRYIFDISFAKKKIILKDIFFANLNAQFFFGWAGFFS